MLGPSEQFYRWLPVGSFVLVNYNSVVYSILHKLCDIRIFIRNSGMVLSKMLKRANLIILSITFCVITII